MHVINPTFNISPEKIELDDVIDQSTISLMTQTSITPKDFYLTGYEPISFKRTREFALETVIASVIHLEKNLLIVANNEDDLHIQTLCNLYNVSNTIIALPQTDKELEVLISTLHKEHLYSHILVSLDVNTPENKKKINKLAYHLQRTSIRLIVHCRRKPMNLDEVKKINIAYMICNGKNSFISSVVLACRSQLVQTEGQSRNHKLDLYNYWQKTLYNRKPGIKPMAV